jgi:hypothetical protein
VGVNVDEARRDDLARGIELATARESLADPADAIACDGDVCGAADLARSIYYASASNHEVCSHRDSFRFG